MDLANKPPHCVHLLFRFLDRKVYVLEVNERRLRSGKRGDTREKREEVARERSENERKRWDREGREAGPWGKRYGVVFSVRSCGIAACREYRSRPSSPPPGLLMGRRLPPVGLTVHIDGRCCFSPPVRGIRTLRRRTFGPFMAR